MRIYEKEDFKELPNFFWEFWFQKMKQEIITYSYPLFLVRVAICDVKHSGEIHQKMYDIRAEKRDALYYFSDNLNGVHICFYYNTIIDYNSTLLNGMLKTLPNDKEIEEESNMNDEEYRSETFFEKGAKWMRDKITEIKF